MSGSESQETPEVAIERFLGELVSAGIDGAVARIEIDGQVVLTRAAGADVDGKRVETSSWFDLASLTKAFVGTLALVLDVRGDLSLRSTVGEVLVGAPGFLAKLPLEDLLRHRSGLKPWLPLYEWVDRDTGVLDCLFRDSTGGGDVPCYSDLGFIFWGLIAEEAVGKPLFGLLQEHVLVPLGAERALAAVPGPRPEVLACCLDNGVEVRLAKELGVSVAEDRATRRGVPQDGNARFLTGIGEMVGHCGLFGSAAGVAALARGWLTDDLLSRERREGALATSDRYAVGWWRFLGAPAAEDPTAPSGAASDTTRRFGPSSFGMIGFTGTSCWVDPSRGLVAVLLAHRQRSDLEMNPWRQRFHRLALSLSDSRSTEKSR
ncbi:MAG: beta-lactamase family protein [Thermoanaerobaculia bacterium]|nr:beta-lactamase family protein [Thermoanaerobaculia bacterium]